MKIELITPESGPSRRLRKWRLIRFPQLTMPLLAAYTPPGVELHHTDEIVEPVDLDRDADLVAITCNTPAAAPAAGASFWADRTSPPCLRMPCATPTRW